MATKSEQLRAALRGRGFVPVDSKSSRDCLTGVAKNGQRIWVWLDKMGGGRYNASSSKIGTAMPLTKATITKLLNNEDSNLAPLTPVPEAEVPVALQPKSQVERPEAKVLLLAPVREALAPFVSRLRDYDDSYPDAKTLLVPLTLGDLRRAQRLLEAL